MRCDQVRERMDDLVDGAPMDATAASEARRHLERCEDCRAEERSLRALLTRASTLPESIEPERDLWPGIVARIERRPAGARPGAPAWVGIAASLLVVLVTGGIGWGLLGTGQSGPGPAQAPRAPGALEVSSRQVTPPDLAAAERTLLRAKLQMIGVLEARRESMSPETSATIDRNMKVMEKAVNEIREALERDPGNAELNRMLMAAHRRELDLLERVTTRTAGL